MAKKLTDFKDFTAEQAQNYLAAHLPSGLIFSKRYINNSNTYKLLYCLAIIYQIFSGQIFSIAKNTNIRKVDELLSEWEKSAYIPLLVPRRDTIEGRREAIERMISRIPVYNLQNRREVDITTTMEEYIRLLTGLEVEIEMAYDTPSTSAFPLTFPVTFDYSPAEEQSIFVIKVPIEGGVQNNIFPMTFPISFFEPEIPQEIIDLLDIILDRIIPAYAVWIYEIIPA